MGEITQYLKRLSYLFILFTFCGCQPMGSKDNLAYPSSDPGRQNLTAQTNPTELTVKGNIPPWLHGTLLRVGPSWFGNNPPEGSLHWFDGLSMLHAFEINNNKILYYNKLLESEAFMRAKNEDIFAFQGFATNPYDNVFQNVLFMLFGGDETPNANVNIYKVAGKYLALTELPPPVEFDRETLKTIGGFPYTDSLPKANVFESAHPQYDLEQQCFYNYIVKFFPTTSYLIYKIPERSSERKLLLEIKVDHPSYMHSFSITKNYIILTEYPFKLADNLIFSGKPFIKNYAWDKNAKTKITIINKRCPCNIKTYFAEPFFSFHHINAYEENNNIILNIIAYKDSHIIEHIGFFPDHLDPSFFLNMRIDLTEDTTQTRKIPLGYADLPRINSAYNGRPYGYFYAINVDKNRHTLFKWDTKQNTRIFWSEEGCFAGEPIFIQNPTGHGGEDDGVILSLVLDVNKKVSFLLVLDAKNFKELARTYLLHGVPFGLHGQFYHER